jgi:Flp pilus assembly protein TadD
MRTGEFRICPRCQARNKVTQPHCVQCGRSLFSIPLSRAPAESEQAAAARAARGQSWTRWVMVAGVLLAMASGLFVRGTFRGASLEPMADETVSASEPARPSLTASAAPAEPPPTVRDFEKGRALLQRGDAQGALRALTPVAQAEPDNAVIAHAYGRALWATGSRDRAVMQFERAARIDPHTPAYRIDLGRSLAALRRTREAIREYEAAVSLDPGNAETVLALAGLYARAGDHVESRALLERAAMLRSGDAALAQRLASTDGSQTATSYTPSTPSSPSVAVPASSAVPTSSSGSSGPARAPSSGIVYTEEDLRRAGTGRTPGAVAPQPPPPVVRADGDQALGEDEAKWRDKATERREAVRSAEQRVATQRARVAQLQRQAEGTSDDADVERELTQALDDLDSAQERLAKAQRRMEDLQDEARRKSVPPDWVR